MHGKTLHVAQVVKNEGPSRWGQVLVQSKTPHVAQAPKVIQNEGPLGQVWALVQRKTQQMIQAPMVQNEGPLGQDTMPHDTRASRLVHIKGPLDQDRAQPPMLHTHIG